MFEGYQEMADRLSSTQFAIFVCLNTIVALLYTVLMVLCMRNIWVILGRLGEWK